MPEIKLDTSDIDARFWEDVNNEKALRQSNQSRQTFANMIKSLLEAKPKEAEE